ncbi:MAG: acyltransferase [Rhizobium sp.]|nr:acyltransferase [Rhizobium sp.]
MRFLAFDGLRGLFSLLVVLAHVPAATVLRQSGLSATGDTLVDLFFVFSGFVIAAGYEKRLLEGYGTGRFLIERLGRIYPIHFVMLVVFILTEIAFATVLGSLGQQGRVPFEGDKAIEAIFSHLTLIHAWNVHDMPTWNYPTWSLSTEWAAYIVFALALLVLRRRFTAAAVVGIGVSIMVLLTVAPGGMQSYHDYGVFRSILGFSAGVIAYRAFDALNRRQAFCRISRPVFTALEIGGLVGLFGLQVAFGATDFAVALPLVFTLLMIVFAYGRGHFSALMGSRPLVYLGTISLSIYVVHVWIIMRAGNLAALAERLTGLDLVNYVGEGNSRHLELALPPLAANLLAVLVVAGVVLVSHFTYRYVELPGQALFRRLAKRLSPVVAEPGRVAAVNP